MGQFFGHNKFANDVYMRSTFNQYIARYHHRKYLEEIPSYGSFQWLAASEDKFWGGLNSATETNDANVITESSRGGSFIAEKNIPHSLGATIHGISYLSGTNLLICFEVSSTSSFIRSVDIESYNVVNNTISYTDIHEYIVGEYPQWAGYNSALGKYLAVTVDNSNNERIEQYNSDGSFEKRITLSSSDGTRPYHITGVFQADNNLWALCRKSGAEGVYKITSSGLSDRIRLYRPNAGSPTEETDTNFYVAQVPGGLTIGLP